MSTSRPLIRLPLALHQPDTQYDIEVRRIHDDGAVRWEPLVTNASERLAVAMFDELRRRDYCRLIRSEREVEREGDINGVTGWWSR